MITQDNIFNVDTLQCPRVKDIDSVSTVVEIPSIRKEGIPKVTDNFSHVSFGLFLGCFVVLVSVRVIFPKYLNSLFQSVVYGGVADRLYRELPYRIGHAAFRLDILAWLMISFLGVEILQFFKLVDQSKLMLLFFTLSFTAIYSFSRYYLISFFGWIFNIKDLVDEFLFNNALFIKILGIILLFLNICLTYIEVSSNVLIITLLPISSLCGLFMFFRSILVLLRKHFSIFYLILYLCTLEILPILLISKWLLG